MSNVQAPGQDYTVTIKAEFQALDSLGPRTRHAINNSKFVWSAKSLLDVLRAQHLDPCALHIDMACARLVQTNDRAKFTEIGFDP